MPYPGLLPRAPVPGTVHCEPYLCRRHSNTILSQSLCGLWILVCTMLEYSEHLWGLILNAILPLLQSYWSLGLPLCPWMWCISSKSLQRHSAATPAPTMLLGLLCPWTLYISSQPLQSLLFVVTRTLTMKNLFFNVDVYMSHSTPHGVKCSPLMPTHALTAGGASSYKNSLVEEFSNNLGGWRPLGEIFR